MTTPLTARRAVEIAHEYGFRARDVRLELVEARKMDGYVGRSGPRSAESLFQGWVADLAAEERAQRHAVRYHERLTNEWE